MNPVNTTDVTLLSLSIADFVAAGVTLQAHDYYVSGGLTVLGVVLTYLYHKYGSSTPA